MNINIVISVHIIVFCCILFDYSIAHLGDSCSLGVCLNSFLVPIQNAFCDHQDNRCKCQHGFVQVGLHKCAEPQSHGGPCEHENVCKAYDDNLTCDRTRYKPVCECRKSFVYDNQLNRCTPQIKKPKSAPIFPITAVILIACIGIFCGCGIICHNFRRQPELSLGNDQLRRMNALPNGSAAATRSSGNEINSVPNAQSRESPSAPPLLRPRSTNGKYDSLLYDDPPPKYEDAIKESFPSDINVSIPISQTPQLLVSK